MCEYVQYNTFLTIPDGWTFVACSIIYAGNEFSYFMLMVSNFILNGVVEVRAAPGRGAPALLRANTYRRLYDVEEEYLGAGAQLLFHIWPLTLGHVGSVSQAEQFTLSPFIDNRCNTFKVDDMLRCTCCVFRQG